MRAWKVPVEGPIVEVDLDPGLGNTPQLVGYRWVEFVRVPDPTHYMIVNESGLIKGKPANPRASKLYPGPTPICDDVLIVGWDVSKTAQEQVETADSSMLTREQVEHWIMAGGYR